ncbi:hypothetical protein P3X46_002977 [Hevea brasiliensis]|uniref:CBS domain-containing protein n=1 Tax=Hevea brasiliensis TaxID=3981 RepID=A0ABQ9N5H5_HEVBR|nr:hypothetical protein P3X46_002977 [Hevea brasiliensis]
MAHAEEVRGVRHHSKFANYDAYFEIIQSRKKLPQSLQETFKFCICKDSTIQIPAETSIADAVKILSECNIMAAPVKNPDAGTTIVLWVLESAELADVALLASTATAAEVGTEAVGTLGAVALGITVPATIAGLTAAAVGAAAGKNGPTAADNLGKDFYKLILQEEPFKSTTLRSVLNSYRWAAFHPVATDNSMSNALLLLSKYRLRNVPVIEPGNHDIKNFITQSAIVQGLDSRGVWFNCIAAQSISDFELPFMSPNELIGIQSNELILEAFKQIRENQIGSLPVVEGPKKKIVGRNIRGIRHLLLKPELFNNFRQLTVTDCMKTISSTQEISRVIPPITCKLDATLASVIHSLASMAVHRIYVVAGNENEVVGVISCFIFEPPNYSDNYLGANEMFND